MLGLNSNELMTLCEEVMSDNELDCSQAVNEVYRRLYGFDVMKDAGVGRVGVMRLCHKLGSLSAVLESILISQGFVECEPELGSIGVVEDSCAIYISDGVYAHKSTNGVKYSRYLEVRNWKCHKP
jgi:hypothetical protein